MNAATIELCSVSKSFGPEVQAVKNVSLKIEPGTLVTLLGPSGSGKTTLLRAIAGFEDITSGEILIDGESVAHVPTHRRRLGMVAQDYALFPHMTVKDNLEFGIKSAHRARRDPGRLKSGDITNRVNETLDLVGLDGFQHRRPQQLSGGQKQRVALARALVTQPRVLLLDEPFAALDKHLREQLQIEVRRVQQQVGITTVFVTHDQGEALSMSDKIAVLSHGQVEQYAGPQEIYDAPATRFVAGFIGRINLLKGEVIDQQDGQVYVRLVDGTEVRFESNQRAVLGQEVQFSVRPEHLRVTQAGVEPPSGHNVISGTVKHCVYLGDRIDVVVESAVGDLTSNLVSDRRGVAEFRLDDAVQLCFSSTAGTVLPDALPS